MAEARPGPLAPHHPGHAHGSGQHAVSTRVHQAMLHRGAASQWGQVPLQASGVFSRQVFPKCGEQLGSPGGGGCSPALPWKQPFLALHSPHKVTLP